jgi:hypothetical protein
MTDVEMFDGQAWIDQYFTILHAPDGCTIQEYYEEVINYQKKYKIKFDTVSGDPFNEFNYKIDQRQDLDIQDLLTLVRRESKKNGFHSFITNHPSATPYVQMAKGKRYYIAPESKQCNGGLSWSRKGQAIIIMHRQSQNECTDKSIDYVENNAQFIVEKAKPKGIGKPGNAELFFDFKQSRYYEEIGEVKYYSRHPDNFTIFEKDFNEPMEVYNVPENETFSDNGEEQPF